MEFTLSKIKCLVILSVEDAEGKPEEAHVTIFDKYGNVIYDGDVKETDTIEVSVGTYEGTAITSDGRQASVTFVCSPELETVEATFTLPVKPVPIFIILLPYLAIAGLISAVIIVAIRWWRKKKPVTVRV